ncbi:MAG TPA: biotin--[acetyl-CoA-carboxylase] ligase [Bacteroidia bacterium]|nr:biotin--[acetyl-CoA-carboxylase] ligase [Bacteroidia bacterium]HNT79488.1 biotin--[acetyl-CoA-carboxylase] ligase [Bacteroidia bacterium]
MDKYQIRFVNEVDSTNSYAANLLRSNNKLQDKLVIAANAQLAGRGQKGTIWQSDAGKNILISIVLKPESIEAKNSQLLYMVTSLGVIDFVYKYFSENVRIKWPNDIMIGSSKLAGILIENEFRGNLLNHTIIGIGININQKMFGGIENDAISLSQITGREMDINVCIDEFLNEFDHWYKLLLSGELELIQQTYTKKLYLLNNKRPYIYQGRTIEAAITGVSDTGSLVLEHQGLPLLINQPKELSYKTMN